MSHDLDESTGKPAMAYVGEKPWHGLGQELPPGQDIDPPGQDREKRSDQPWKINCAAN